MLNRIGAKLREGGPAGAVIQEAARAGHGVGKSSFSSWLIHWGLTTFPRARGVVTAMTETQLRTKTWAELSKWHAMFIAREIFELQATSIRIKNETVGRYWRIDAVPWSEKTTSSFAGLHNKGKRVILIFDEASEIDDRIWEVSEGALTDEKTQIIWAAFGNPTRTSGKFFQCFDSANSRWHVTTVDARESKFSNKALIELWKSEYGEDSDFFRVRVKGEPPRAGVKNFISPDLVRAARRRSLVARDYQNHPIVIGVDPARFGDDLTVITIRQGPLVHKQFRYSGLDGWQVGARVTEHWRGYPTTAKVAVDGIGIGASAVDYLKRIPGLPLLDVNVSTKAFDEDTYYNHRAEIWDKMRKFLETAQIPDDNDLENQLVTMDYGFDGRARIQLQSKDDLRKLGKPSPDLADSLALTFAPDTIAMSGVNRVVYALPRTNRHAHVLKTGT